MTVDLILLLVLIVFILSGYRRGLILSLCSLLILIISCLGASAAQEILTPRITAQLTPQVTAIISQNLETVVAESAGNALSESGSSIGTQIGGISQILGLDLDQAIENAVESAAAPLVASAAQALAESLVNAFAGTLVFLAAFLILYLLLRSVELGFNAVDRLPVIHTLNHLGGGVVGCISGAFTLVMISALLKNTEFFPDETFSGPISLLLQSVVAKILG